MRDSFIFYESFNKAIITLNEEDQYKLMKAIINYGLYGELSEIDGIVLGMFSLIKPQLDANNKRYIDGKKGGRPKKETSGYENNETSGYGKKEPNKNVNDNVNVNENDNVNVNENDNENNIYEILEKNFGRTISPIEYEKINNWLLLFNEDIISYGIELCVMQNKKTFAYLEGILKNWKSQQYKTLDEIKENSIKQEGVLPTWLNQENNAETMSESEKDELEELLSDFK